MNKNLKFNSKTPIIEWFIYYGSTLEALAAYREKQKQWKQEEKEHRRAKRKAKSSRRKEARALAAMEARTLKRQMRAFQKDALAPKTKKLSQKK